MLSDDGKGFFLSFFLFSIIYIVFIYKGSHEPEVLKSHLNNEPLTAIMLLMLGIGGMLAVRFILERSKGGTT